jgi:hypothetical protein
MEGLLGLWTPNKGEKGNENPFLLLLLLFCPEPIQPLSPASGNAISEIVIANIRNKAIAVLFLDIFIFLPEFVEQRY